MTGNKKIVSIAIGFEFQYGGRTYEHVFWSLSDLQNYFRWEPGRAQLVDGNYEPTVSNNRSTNGLLKLIALDASGARKKEKIFATYGEMVNFIGQKKIRIGRY
jgi:hypothetical protein